MFGYITADVSRLTQSAKAEYKKAYCGLCRALARRYGAKARFLLSFDTTFLLLMLAESGDGCDIKNCRCPYHLGRKRDCFSGKVCDYAADVTVLLACLNFEDDIKDTRSLRAKIQKLLFGKELAKAKKYQPQLFDTIRGYLSELDRVEKQDEQNPDIPAGIFGGLLSEVFSFDKKLSQFGYYLGRFIYLCDAVCDFKSDIRHGRYNPLTSHRTSEFEDLLAYNTEKCLEILQEIGMESEIADNVLRYGVWLRYSIKFKRTV